MNTYVFDKELLKKEIDRLVTDDKIVILSDIPHGNLSAASKRKKAKTVGIAFAESVFKNKDTITDILSSQLFGIIIMDKKYLSDSSKKEVEEYYKRMKVQK